REGLERPPVGHGRLGGGDRPRGEAVGGEDRLVRVELRPRLQFPEATDDLEVARRGLALDRHDVAAGGVMVDVGAASAYSSSGSIGRTSRASSSATPSSSGAIHGYAAATSSRTSGAALFIRRGASRTSNPTRLKIARYDDAVSQFMYRSSRPCSSRTA